MRMQNQSVQFRRFYKIKNNITDRLQNVILLIIHDIINKYLKNKMVLNQSTYLQLT